MTRKCCVPGNPSGSCGLRREASRQKHQSGGWVRREGRTSESLTSANLANAGTLRVSGAAEGSTGRATEERLSGACGAPQMTRKCCVSTWSAPRSKQTKTSQHELHFGDVEPAAELAANFSFDADNLIPEPFVQRD
jgi:hypothetical protein